MPTDYPGSSVATQAPSGPPGPEAPITVAIPADGDPPNASTFAQPFKVLADFIMWLVSPFAKTSDFAAWIMGWRSATGHKRFLIDHLGFPNGQFIAQDTAWSKGFGSYITTASPAPGRREPGAPHWTYISQGAATSDVLNILGDNPNGPDCLVRTLDPTAGSTGDHTTFSSGPYGHALPTVHLQMDVLAAGFHAGHANVESACLGFGEYLDASGVNLDNFIGFETRGSTTWYAVTRNGGAETVTNTLAPIVRDPTDPVFAGAVLTRLKVEWHGEAVAEDGLRRVRFYVDGALVATHSTNLPAGRPMNAILSCQKGSGTKDPVLVGPVRVRLALFPADVS